MKIWNLKLSPLLYTFFIQYNIQYTIYNPATTIGGDQNFGTMIWVPWMYFSPLDLLVPKCQSPPITPTIYIILPSWNHSIVKIMFKVLKTLISSSWVNGQYMAEVQRLCVLMEKLSSIYQIKSWYLLWEKICTFYLLNGLLCSQHDP